MKEENKTDKDNLSKANELMDEADLLRKQGKEVKCQAKLDKAQELILEDRENSK